MHGKVEFERGKGQGGMPNPFFSSGGPKRPDRAEKRRKMEGSREVGEREFCMHERGRSGLRGGNAASL